MLYGEIRYQEASISCFGLDLTKNRVSLKTVINCCFPTNFGMLIMQMHVILHYLLPRSLIFIPRASFSLNEAELLFITEVAFQRVAK